ncbi:MAG TPA: gamma-glutamyltransferase, partial [Pseudomonadales bacterium]
VRFENFNPRQANTSDEIGAGRWGQESTETTHYSVMDGKGNAVSVTTTLNLAYGNKIVVPGTGFLLNNEMDDFSAKPGAPNVYGLLGSEANRIEPGKRMLSSMSPTIVTENNKAILVTGSPGGSTIINTVLQVLINVLDHGMPLNDAVGLPRFHHQWEPDKIFHEFYAFSPDTLQKLKAMKHNSFVASSRMIGDANSVMQTEVQYEVDNKVVKEQRLFGMSDPRNDGGAAAY